MSDQKPVAWLCELAQDDGTTRTMIVQEDPSGLRFNDIGEPSPFKVTPLYAANAIERQAEEFDALAHLLAQRDADIERLTAERNHAVAKFERAVLLMTGIHALLYPAPVNTPDGRTMVFRPPPESLDTHEVLQELSDRIRALPDELERIAPSDLRRIRPLNLPLPRPSDDNHIRRGMSNFLPVTPAMNRPLVGPFS